MNKCKKLIEVALPVKEISAESVRDKSIRHGHISTLHLWWARRPLPVCRAIVFASLVPDPLDKNCPQQFRDAVELLLGAKQGIVAAVDDYKPYKDIPYTSIEDVMKDNLRNRLLMYIGKFSDAYIENEKKGKKTPAKNMLSDKSLIKWENKNNEDILEIARKLIWVAHDPVNNTLIEFDKHYSAIKAAETSLYECKNRHKKTKDIKDKEKILEECIMSFQERMPKVFDPFAGGGAIPLEAARLGCRTYGNDINPVAHIVQRASVEFPQKYGKPIEYSNREFEKLYEDLFLEDVTHTKIEPYEDSIEIKNRLAFDVEYYARKMLLLAESEIGHLYPTDEDGNEIVAYYWAHVAKCSNPACNAKVPMLRQFYLCNKPKKKIYLKPVINDKKISFKIENGETNEKGWVSRGNLTCPICGNTTEVKILKKQKINGIMKESIIAVIYNTDNGKTYRILSEYDLGIVNEIDNKELIKFRPNDIMPVKYTQALPCCTWGITKWGQLFSDRQLLVMQTMTEMLEQVKKEIFDNYDKRYAEAVITYLAILINRISTRITSFGLWNTKAETLEHPFGRQAIPMVFDYPEANIFSSATGGAINQIDWIIRYILTESHSVFSAVFNNTASGDNQQFKEKELNSVITDPPYYNAIAYADLSDFFYLWFKRTLKDIYPENFATPQTPKTEECTALKHHHENSEEKAKKHFEDKLLEIFKAIEKQTDGVISIMFAHQSTEAWTTLCNSILNAEMNITGSWAMNTERTSGTKTNKSFLASSVTVSCQPVEKAEYGDYSEVKKAIRQNIEKEVKYLYGMGFRGADLLTSCFGQAASEIGKYKIVEKADGSEVTVAELLQFAREAAFESIISDIDTDDVTRFYIGWLNLFGFSEAEHDDVQRITQIGLAIDLGELERYHILKSKSSRHNLADYKYRTANDAKLGLGKKSKDIDKVHRAMQIYSSGTHKELILYLSKAAPDSSSSFWRVLNSLVEVLPKGLEDHQAATGILTGEEGLLREIKQNTEEVVEQAEIEF